MKHTYHYLAVALSLIIASCTSTRTTVVENDDVLTATEIEPYGRYMIRLGQPLELISSAVHFGYTFKGTESQVYASVPADGKHGYLQYVLDGEYKGRIKVSPGSTEPINITAQTDGEHTVWIYKATEAHNGPVLIEKVTGNEVACIQAPEAPVIEFIGNSITSGAAADPSEVPCGTAEYHDQHNAYMAYGPRVARALNANFLLSSVSGYGVYRNWNSDGPALPQVYEKIDFWAENPRLWDFETYSPEIVSIALGTNDLSKGDGIKPRLPFDSTRFVNEYVQFVKLVKDIYPSAQIALLSSPMVKDGNSRLLERSLTKVKTEIDAAFPEEKPVALFFFKPMQNNGCGDHPSIEDHAIMAEQLTPFFRQLLDSEK